MYEICQSTMLAYSDATYALQMLPEKKKSIILWFMYKILFWALSKTFLLCWITSHCYVLFCSTVEKLTKLLKSKFEWSNYLDRILIMEKNVEKFSQHCWNIVTSVEILSASVI